MKNRVIVITGATRGLGLMLANYWQKENTVIGVSRTRTSEVHPGIHHYPCDLENIEETENTAKKICKDFLKIDLLINNAASLTSLPVAVMKTNDISRMIDINLKAPILFTKILFRKMINDNSGQIINILSMSPKLSVVGDSVYAATKSGLEAFSKILNKEGHPSGVHVNNIGISAFNTGMFKKIALNDSNKIIKLIPHMQYAPLEEIISTIEFFTHNSKDIGGQTLYFGGV